MKKEIDGSERHAMRVGIRLFAMLCLAVLCITVASCAPTPPNLPSPADTDPPIFEGLHDIEILQGDGIAYRTGVHAIDPQDGEVPFSVEAEGVNPDLPGEYSVLYRACDAAGNEARVTVTVRVLPRRVTYEELWAAVDPLIASYGYAGLSCEALCHDLYYDIKGRMSYISTSDKSDWVAEAYRGLTERTGDCFTYYAVARAFFERLGISVLTVQRAPDVLPTTHYWLLVNTGDETSPAWYHWDVCPHPMEYPLTSILLTDAELLSYNDKMPHYYTFDTTRYPATPIESKKTGS